MGFTAIRLSNSKDTQWGFCSKEAAESYISKFLCESCEKEARTRVRTGHWPDGEEFIENVSGVLDTDCGAEWGIITDEEFEKYKKSGDLKIVFSPDKEQKSG